MLDLKSFADPKTLNEPVWPPLRWAAALVLATGAVLCLILLVDLLRHWGVRPNPAFFLLFIGSVGVTAAVLAVRLFRGERITRPVDRPPRPLLVRVLGLLVFVVGGLTLLVTDTWRDRVEMALVTLAGLGWLLWPRRYVSTHGA